MASATTTSTKDDHESCVLCSSNHNRTRPSFCQCKHCSIPLCLDCMKEHHDELLQDVGGISHQYNELQQLLQTRQMMVDDETAKSIEDVNRYFETYINELRQTQQKIIENIEKAKQDAQDHVRKLDSDLRSLGGEIQGLNKEGVFQMTKTKDLSTELNKIQQEISTYQATRTDNLFNTQPDFSIKFDCSPAEIETPHSSAMETNEICQTRKDAQAPSLDKECLEGATGIKNYSQGQGFSWLPGTPVIKFLATPLQQPDPQQPTFKTNTFNFSFQSPVALKYPTNQRGKNDDEKGESNDCSISDDDDDDTESDENHIDTSYNADRMASDGKNVLYTSYSDKGSDRIAYCLIDDDDDNDDDDDECRHWKQSRIVDMIWWGSIGKFICATENGIYTVDYANRRFKITDVIRGNWSFIRVAANPTHLFIWIKSVANDFQGIEVYSTQFDHIRKIDFNKCQTEPFLNDSVSFCVTNNHIASICTQKQDNREILQVIFCDMNMNKFNSIPLDECSRNIEIRTDGKDLFFITTGRRSFYITSIVAVKQTINLQNNGKWIAVLDNQRIAISNGHSDIELVTY